MLLTPDTVIRLALLGALVAAGSAQTTRTNQGKKPASSTELSRVDRYFALCDHDADGLISFSEASESLGIDQAGFRVYDKDRDGLIIAGEFRRRYEEITANGGVFLPPKPRVATREVAVPERADLALEAFDTDRDEDLDSGELATALVKVGATKLEPTELMEQLDRDQTGGLEATEIDDLLELLRPSSASKGPKPRTIDELFGKHVPRKIEPGSTSQPIRITPPVSPFRRLDIDDDGVISVEDLLELQRPLVLPVRAPAVLAAIDTDRDGVISRAEFRTSMQPSP